MNIECFSRFHDLFLFFRLHIFMSQTATSAHRTAYYIFHNIQCNKKCLNFVRVWIRFFRLRIKLALDRIQWYVQLFCQVFFPSFKLDLV